MIKPLVSVIIPCYNHGQYLHECIGSVKAQTYSNVEIVLVNDGSTESDTNTIISDINDPAVKKITKANGGLAAARNTGIEAARGEIILPLDADDKISEGYIKKGVEILLKDSHIAIVYCRGKFFGNSTGNMANNYTTFRNELLYNEIFCSALFRKADFIKAGRYNLNMVNGYEDWDLWIRMLSADKGVIQLAETMFFYRQSKQSMLKSLNDNAEKLRRTENLIFTNNLPVYIQEYGSLLGALRELDILRKEKYISCAAAEAVKKTFSYRLGNFLLTPFRLLRRKNLTTFKE